MTFSGSEGTNLSDILNCIFVISVILKGSARFEVVLSLSCRLIWCDTLRNV